MKKIITIGFLCWGIITLLWGCYDDKGNYDYHDLPVLEIDTVGIKNERTQEQMSVLKIEPDIRYDGSKEDLIYLWVMYPKNEVYNKDKGKYPEAIKLSEQPVLEYVLDVPANKYVVRLTVTDKINKTSSFMTFQVEVLSAFSKGLMVLAEKEGAFDVDLVHSLRLEPTLEADKEGVIRNIYSVCNQEKLYAAKSLYQKNNKVYIFTEDGGVRLNNITFEQETDYNDLFLMPEAIASPMALETSFNNMFYIINGKTLHSVFGTGRFSTPLLGDYEAAPFLTERKRISGVNGPNLVIYDTKHQRFMQLPLFGKKLGVYEAMTPGAPFDLNQIGMKLMHMENGYNDYCYHVFLDEKTGTWYLYVINLNTVAQGPILKADMAGCADISEHTLYAFGTRGEVCYYAADNKVYLYDYKNSNLSSTDGGYCFGMNEKVAVLKVFKSPSDQNLDSKLLLVATNDAETGEGRVYILEVNEHTGIVNKSTVKMFDGFGMIKDLCFKQS